MLSYLAIINQQIKINHMKSLLFTLVMLVSFCVCAQEKLPNLQLNTSIENLPCEKDLSERTIVLEKIQNDQLTTINTFHSNGCIFTLPNIPENGKYQLTVSVLGYEDSKITFEISDTASEIILEPIILKEKNNTLNEVNVFGNKKEFLKVDSDKTTVSIKENAMLNSGNSLDAVKKLPGVIASPTGSLTLNGKGVAIYIDGAPSTLSGNDLQNYLSSLPANAIEKVELIYNPGASFDANSSGSVINIVTSSKRMKGINASFNINYNFNKYQKPSPQILLNGKEKNLSWQTMVGYNYIDSDQKGINDQAFTYFTPVRHLRQENFALNTNRNFYFRVGTNYKLSEKSNLLFNYNLNLGNDRSVFESSAVADTINFRTKGISKTKNDVNEISLQYKTKLDTLGRTLDVIGYMNLFGRNPITASTATDLMQPVGFQNTLNNGDVDFDLKNYYLKYDFGIPLKNDFSINTGGKYNIIKVSDLGKYVVDSGNPSIIDFDYTETNLAFYAEARKKYKKFNFTAGLRFEDFNVDRTSSTVEQKIEYKNTNFFPNASILYEATKDINLSTSYSKKIAQPDYYILDPNNNSAFDTYNTSQGNPLLKPTYFDNYEFKVSAFQYVSLGVNYSVLKDHTRFVFNAEDGKFVSNSTTQQFDRTTILSAFASFPIPLDYFFKSKEEFQKRLNAMDKMNYIFVNVNYVKSDYKGLAVDLPNKAITNFSFQSQIILPWEITNTMSYFILPKGTWEIYQIQKPIQQFDISFNRDFMNKNLKIGLHCFDVFNANEVNALIAGKNLTTNFYQKPDTRTFRISLTYNFGNLKLEKENTSINTEKVNQGGGMLK